MDELEIKARNYLKHFVLEVIPDSNQNYDYTNWNISWKITPATTDSILQTIFGLDNQEEVIYCRKNYFGILQDFIGDIQDEILIKKFFRFYMCLPVFEYEYVSKNYDNLADIPPYNGSETTNSFMRSICNFKYEGRFKKITDRKLNMAVNEIHDSEILKKKHLRKFIVDIKDPTNVPKSEYNYISNSKEKVLLPLLSIIDEILGKPSLLEAERLKIDNNNSVSKVDLGVYDKNESLNRMYCSIEFKQFPICPKNYGPNGMIDLNQLFLTESTDFSKSPPINRFLKQLLCEMMSHKTNRGILTDSYTYIFIEIDLKRFNNDLKSTMSEGATLKTAREIPLNYIIKNNHSQNVTLRQALLEFLNGNIIENDAFKVIEKQMENLVKYYHLKFSEVSNLELKKTSKHRNSSRTTSKRARSYGSSSHRNHPHEFLDDECREEISSGDSDSIFSSISSKNSNEIEILDSNDKNEKKYKNSFHIEFDRRIKYKNDDMSILVSRSSIDILKHGDNYYSQVYVVDAKYFLDYLSHPILTKDKVVIKIHDALHFPTDYFLYDEFYSNFTRQQIRDEKEDICYNNYCFENECYEILSKNPKFNSIGYNQKDLYLVFCCEDKFHRVGWTNIFKYIETQPMPKDIETYKKALEQLKIIHENGIIHNDISNRNILYSKDGKVYIIDFSEAYSSSDDIGEMDDEKSVLRNIFFKDEPERITEFK